MRLYFRAASMILHPSRMLCETGFSTYTSLPAWQAQIASRACQWSGVAITTASTSRRSRMWRGSVQESTPSKPSIRSASRSGSTSHIATRRTPGNCENTRACCRPLPPMPITATRTSSLAPSTRDAGNASAAAPATVVLRNSRREDNIISFVIVSRFSSPEKRTARRLSASVLHLPQQDGNACPARPHSMSIPPLVKGHLHSSARRRRSK